MFTIYKTPVMKSVPVVDVRVGQCFYLRGGNKDAPWMVVAMPVNLLNEVEDLSPGVDTLRTDTDGKVSVVNLTNGSIGALRHDTPVTPVEVRATVVTRE